MLNYKVNDIAKLLSENEYPGRGIILGTTPDGNYNVCAYFIMGRSLNSRNRIFVMKEDGLYTEAFDASKVQDPSLIIYSPLKTLGDKLVVSNGNQTDTVVDGLKSGISFKEALESREYEPDAPNFTPRISGIVYFGKGAGYELSALKKATETEELCERYTYSYPKVNGLGHFIHTYQENGNPIPSFFGEPERIATANCIDEFTNTLWSNLNEDNKISLYVRYTKVDGSEYTDRLINKNVEA